MQKQAGRDIQTPDGTGIAQSSEYWAMNTAHQIVLQHVMPLVEAAQCLDRKRINAQTYALRQAIMESLLEACHQHNGHQDGRGRVRIGAAE